MTNDNMTVTDIVGYEYKEWEKGFVILNCGTGRGKTHFIFNKLLDFACEQDRKVLYLCNRTALKKQIEQINLEQTSDRISQLMTEMKESDFENTSWYEYAEYNLTITTYQELQVRLMTDNMMEERYRYIVCDEAHYFFVDAGFNHDTEIAWEYINSQIQDNVVILMSATANPLFETLQQDTGCVWKEYHLEQKYDLFNGIFFYNSDEELEDIVRKKYGANQLDKIMIFSNKAELYKKLSNEYGENIDCLCAITARSKASMFCPHRQKILNNITQTNTFNARILLTTSVLDNGVNIIDTNVKYIFCDFTSDIHTALQALGRKRKQSLEDTCTLYLRRLSSGETVQRLNGVNEQLRPAEIYKGEDNKWNHYQELVVYIKQHCLERRFYKENNILYSDFENKGLPAVNQLALLKYESDAKYFNGILENGFERTFTKYHSQKLYDMYVRHESKERKQFFDSLIKCLEKYENKKLYLYLEEHKGLLDKLEKMGIKNKQCGKVNNRIKAVGYQIVSDKSKTSEHRDKVYWMVKKIDNE